MDYDVLGRRTLHSDPSAGATETTYNGFGETVTETDANDDTTTYTYDVLGRVEKVTSPDGTESRTMGCGEPRRRTAGIRQERRRSRDPLHL